MAKILLIYHSQSQRTFSLSQAVKEGLLLETEEIRYKKAFDTKVEDVLWADGILIGTPENFGTMSGAVKDFFDRTYYPAREQGLNKPYALFVSCENDGTGAEREIDKIATGYVLKKALPALLVKGAKVDIFDLSQAKELGQTFAAGVALKIF